MSVAARLLAASSRSCRNSAMSAISWSVRPGNAGHAAFRTSGAYKAGHLLPSGVGQHHQRAGEIRSAGASARVDPMAEAALRREHRFRPRDGGLVEPTSSTASRRRAERRRHVRGRAPGALARVQEPERKDQPSPRRPVRPASAPDLALRRWRRGAPEHSAKETAMHVAHDLLSTITPVQSSPLRSVAYSLLCSRSIVRAPARDVLSQAPVTFLTNSKNCRLLSVLIVQFTGGLWNPSW